MATPETPIPPKAPRGNEPSLMDRLRELPRPAQIALAVVLAGIVYLVIGGGHGAAKNGGTINVTSASALRDGDVSGTTFNGIETDRPVLMQGWLEQNRREMSDLKAQM
jgi:hypothetical protein